MDQPPTSDGLGTGPGRQDLGSVAHSSLGSESNIGYAPTTGEMLNASDEIFNWRSHGNTAVHSARRSKVDLICAFADPLLLTCDL